MEVNMEFNWEVAYSVVTETSISRLTEDKSLFSYPGYRKPYPAFKYDVTSKSGIYEEFSNIETNNLSCIEDFVNKYGLLGLNIEYEKEILQDKIDGYKRIIKRAINEHDIDNLRYYQETEDTLEVMNKLLIIEETSEFIREVKLMRGLLELNSYKNVKVEEIEIVKNKINEVADLEYIDCTYSGDTYMSDFKLLEHAAKGLISSIINTKMKNVDRHLSLSYDNNKKAFVYIDTWKPKSLLGCMYTMLYMDLAQGRRTEICPVCLYPFIVTDNRDKQVHKSCGRNRNTKNTRERMGNQAKNYIINKYDKRNDPIEDIFETEKDYVFSSFGKSTPFNKKRIGKWLNR